MNSRLIAVPPDNELDHHRQLAQLDSLYRNSPNGVAVLDHDNRYVRVNDALADFHGTAPKKLTGHSPWEFLCDVPPDLCARLKEALKSNKPLLDVELTMKSAAHISDVRHLLAHFYPLESEDGENRSTGMVVVDITERKITEAALRLSEARYRDVVEHSIYGVCSVVSNGFARGANPTMLHILGCSSQEELAGVNFLDDVFRYPDQQAQLFATCRAQGSLQNGEAEWRRDGGIVSVRLHLRKLADGVWSREVHGGFLHVYSEPGQGSLFRIYFPAMPGSVAESNSVAVPSVGEMRGSETVLIADDHESIREMARQTLASLGYCVLCAADGEEALRLCEQNTPQIAVLDVVMPRLGGTATADKLLVRFPELRVIFTSGYSRDRDERSANLSQASYLQKPYSPTRLGRLVRDILDGQPKPASSRHSQGRALWFRGA